MRSGLALAGLGHNAAMPNIDGQRVPNMDPIPPLLSGLGVVKPKLPAKPKTLTPDQMATTQQSGLLRNVLIGGGVLLAVGVGVMIWRSVTKD